MFAQVTQLQYWKSEHDATTCEDASQSDSMRGLFALSDGAGTTLFSNIWAQVLVDQFIAVPLLSDNPFEVEWWVRQAQERYRTSVFDLNSLSWNALQKIQNEGSFATLSTLRITEANNTFARAEILATGDSCIFFESARTSRILPFPLTREGEFDHAPICIPSKPNLFNRYFQRSLQLSLAIEPHDTIVMATDAVSRWIVSRGKGRYKTMEQALHEVMQQTPLTWESFILDCRSRKEMVDDDSTALTISFHGNPGQQQGNYLWLGVTNEHDYAMRKQRKEVFEKAVRAQNKELMAISYGDGKDLSHEGIVLSPDEIQQARQVADALREVLSTLRETVNNPDVVARVEPVWRKYAPVLANEPCAEELRQTLTRLGVSLLPRPAAPPIATNNLDIVNSKYVDESGHISPPEELDQSQDNFQPSTPIQPDYTLQFEMLHERERMALEKQFLHALRSEDDEMILGAHQVIMQSVYANEIVFSLQDMARIELAQQNMRQNAQNGVAPIDPHSAVLDGSMQENRTSLNQHDAIQDRGQNMAQHKADQENGLNLNQHVANQGSVRSMAQAYEQVQQSLSTLSEDERRRLELAYAMSEAFKSGDDDHVVKAFENILHSPYHGFFVFSPEEEDLVAQAERRKIQQVLPSAQEANTQTISNAWFRKLCQLKNLYLQYKQLGRYTEEQIEQWVLADLTNDHYIQEGIEALKKNRSRKMPNPDALLKTEFSAFQASPFVNYAAMSSAYQFSDDEAKAAILMFLRSSVLEGYLAQNNMQMQEWLDTRKRESNANSTHLIGVPEPKRSLLFWWRR